MTVGLPGEEGRSPCPLSLMCPLTLGANGILVGELKCKGLRSDTLLTVSRLNLYKEVLFECREKNLM